MSVFFFLKQETAYVMHISGWSSDLCSSDLAVDMEGGPFQCGYLGVVQRECHRQIAAARCNQRDASCITVDGCRRVEGDYLLGFPDHQLADHLGPIGILGIFRHGSRSAERRVGKEGGRTSRIRGLRDMYKK